MSEGTSVSDAVQAALRDKFQKGRTQGVLDAANHLAYVLSDDYFDKDEIDDELRPGIEFALGVLQQIANHASMSRHG